MKKITFLFLLLSTSLLAQNMGEIDLSNLGFNDVVKVTAIQPDGKILVGGAFTTFNGTSQNCLIRLNPDGTKDTSFNIGNGFTGFNPGPGPAYVSVITLQPDGKILIGGNFMNFVGSCNRIARLNVDGSRDFSFNIGNGFTNAGETLVNAIVLQPDGKILVGGDFTAYKGSSQKYLVRLNIDGTKDTTFNSAGGTFGGPNGKITCIAIAPNGHIFIGGQYTLYNNSNNTEPNLNQLTPNGDLITIYNSYLDPTCIPKTIKILDEFVHDSTYNMNLYKILVGGENAPFLTRLHHSGDIDISFTGQFNNNVNSINFQQDGRMIFAGDFTSYNGSNMNRLIMLNQDWTINLNFDIGSGFDDSVTSVSIQEDGRIWAGGNFTTYNGILSNYVLRLKGNSVLSTNDFIKDKITLYPNPTQNILNFSLPETNTATAYEIYNLLGEKLSNGNLNSNSINVSALAKGVFMVKLITENGVLTEKFIKE